MQRTSKSGVQKAVKVIKTHCTNWSCITFAFPDYMCAVEIIERDQQLLLSQQSNSHQRDVLLKRQAFVVALSFCRTEVMWSNFWVQETRGPVSSCRLFPKAGADRFSICYDKESFTHIDCNDLVCLDKFGHGCLTDCPAMHAILFAVEQRNEFLHRLGVKKITRLVNLGPKLQRCRVRVLLSNHEVSPRYVPCHAWPRKLCGLQLPAPVPRWIRRILWTCPDSMNSPLSINKIVVLKPKRNTLHSSSGGTKCRKCVTHLQPASFDKFHRVHQHFRDILHMNIDVMHVKDLPLIHTTPWFQWPWACDNVFISCCIHQTFPFCLTYTQSGSSVHISVSAACNLEFGLRAFPFLLPEEPTSEESTQDIVQLHVAVHALEFQQLWLRVQKT